MEEMEEDNNEQIGKLIHSGFFFSKNDDEIDKRLQNNLCPRCMCTLQSIDEDGYKKCDICKCMIRDY